MCPSGTRGHAAWALVVGVLASCTVDRSVGDRVFSCDPAAADEGGCDVGFQCNASSAPFGGSGFCAPECTPRPDFTGALCTSSGERIELCVPSAEACPAGLSCLRTDLLHDEGICLPAPTCETSDDCTDPVRRTCMASLVGGGYPGATNLQRSGSFCVQANCGVRSFQACLPGTSCMAALSAVGGAGGSGLPELCVPDCDAKGRCPPNFVCSVESLGKLGPPGGFCVPGLLGFPCSSDVDCLMGKCLSASDRRMCTLECADEASCAAFDTNGFVTRRMRFSCAVEPESGRAECVSPEAYLIRTCTGDADCSTRERCSGLLPEGLLGRGVRGVRVCRPECIDDPAGARCPAYGGLPSACFEGAAGNGETAGGPRVCVPALFGLGCSADGRCVGDLECVAGPGGGRCEKRCTTTLDCRASRWVDGETACGADGTCMRVASSPPAKGHP